MIRYIVEVDAYDPVAAQEETQRFASQYGGFTTAATDTPANTHFKPVLKNPGNFERRLFARSTTQGRSDVGFGEIVLDNTNGSLDFLIDYAFDGRACRLYRWDDTGLFSSRELIITGTVEQPDFSETEITLLFRDRLAELNDTQLTQEVYAGATTSTGNSAEGRPEDIQGQPKPVGFGVLLSVPAVPVNVFDLLYQPTSRPMASVQAVRDAGVALTATSNYADIPALRAASLSPGQYATCFSLGLIRLGGSPSGVIAVDFTTLDTTAADIVDAMLLYAGFGGLSVVSRIDLNAINAAPCGIWVNGTDSVLRAATTVLNSIGAYLTVNRSGQFIAGRLDLPTGTPQATWRDYEYLRGVERVRTGDQGQGVPAKAVTVRYARRWSNEAADSFAGSLSAEDRALLSQEYQSVKEEDATVAVKHLLAPELTFDTLLTNQADAEAEATRRLNIYKARRDRFELSLPARLGPIDLGDEYGLQLNRYGLENGKSFRLIGLVEDYESETLTAEIWG
ncbi:MAG: hypothetical protein AAF141_05875 [Pseudomonadota bacterium]